jgi:hypothetical protein
MPANQGQAQAGSQDHPCSRLRQFHASAGHFVIYEVKKFLTVASACDRIGVAMSKSIKSHTSIQEDAVTAILAAREQGNRAMSYGQSLLNKNPRVIRGIHKAYARAATKLGIPVDGIAQGWRDIRDMATLEAAAQ